MIAARPLLETEIFFHGKIHDISSPSINFPGITNLLSAPQNIAWGAQHTVLNIHMKDHEGITRNATFLSSSILSLIHSATCVFALINQYIVSYFNSSYVNLITGLIGFVLCALELVAESVRLMNQILFRSQIFDYSTIQRLSKDLESLKKEGLALVQTLRKNGLIEETILEKLTSELTELTEDSKALTIKKLESALYLKNINQINREYFTLSQSEIDSIACIESVFGETTAKENRIELEIVKARGLGRRIQPHLFHEYTSTQSKLKSDLETFLMKDGEDPASRFECRDLFNRMSQQSYKAIVIHSIAIAVLLLTIGAIGLTFSTLPPLIPFLVSTAVGLLAVLSEGYKKTALPSRGNEIRLDYLIPNSFRSSNKTLASSTL